MKLKTGQQRYKFVEYSAVHGGYVNGNQRYNQMASINLCQIMIVRMRELPSVRGIPVYYALWNEWIEFYPIPDKPYTVTINYTPPMEQW